MDSTRQNKVARLIQKDLSEIFQGLSRDILQSKMVTITIVRMSPDLALAKVYLSIFPSENLKDFLEIFKKHTAHFRYQLGLRVKNQLRIVPEIAFYIDDSLDYAERIEELLKK